MGEIIKSTERNAKVVLSTNKMMLLNNQMMSHLREFNILLVMRTRKDRLNSHLMDLIISHDLVLLNLVSLISYYRLFLLMFIWILHVIEF